MPVRLIRDGILTSERVCSLGWATEVFYRRLMSVVDDYGRYYAKATLLRAACYPLQLNKVSDSDIEKWLTQVVEAALVRVYLAKDGKRYLEILDFNQRIQSKSKFPEPGEECESTVDHRESPISNRLVGVEDEDDKPHVPASAVTTDRFHEFWGIWPSGDRKAGKAECAKRWKARGLDAVADQILAHVAALKNTKKWLDGFEPAPLTYINQKRWEDGLPEGNSQASMPWENAI
ncbi:hypothetical protein ACOTJF_18040 [Achromobacter ruhlandii]|uniref:hypothetical protein n=1 Tax=Achromobacter ruhlandii TaxID=72557 RepID=UPI003B9FA8B8